MKHTVNTRWTGNMSFESKVTGHKIIMDAPAEVGGEDKGPRPKPLMLAALAGCTGMDVVSILKKMRVEVDDFNVNIDAEMTEEHPKHYTKFHIVYEFKGENLPMDKLEKAVNLSQESYCGVSYMYKQFAEVTHEIQVV